MASSGIVLGLDGGGTKTNACCISVDTKQVLATATTGGSNPNSVGDDKAKDAVMSSLHEALRKAGMEKASVKALCLCMAGVDRPDDIAKVKKWVATDFAEIPCFVYNDAIAALTTGTKGKLEGIVTISGTGMITVGFSPGSMEQLRASGMGPLLGDRGSGYDIGVDLLRKVCEADDGRGPKTIMTSMLLEHLKLSSVMDLIGWAYGDKEWSRFAALSRIVYKAYSKGDEMAVEVIKGAASDLACSVMAVVKRSTYKLSDEIPVVFAGGNLEHEGSPLAELTEKALREKVPNVKILKCTTDYCVGAGLVAITKLDSTK